MSRRSRRSIRERFRERCLSAPERAAARAERQVEAALRRERDNLYTPERRAAALEAERRRLPWYGGVDW